MKPIIDISHHQNPTLINYPTLAAQVEGVMIRACYGNRKDTHFETHYRELRNQGKPLGVYIYITEYMSIESQVATLIQAIQGKTFKLGVWVDVELENGATPLRKATVHAAIQRIEAAIGKPVGIYTSAYYWSQIMNGAYYTTRKLWAADWRDRPTPALPTGWTTYVLHQYTETGRLPGYNGPLDINRFNGTLAQFQSWVNGEQEPQEPEPTAPLTRLYWPVSEDARISQVFGANPGWYPTSKGHNGIDFAILQGTPVKAAEAGTVETAEAQTSGYGRHVRIRHSHGVTIYGHLSKLECQVGDQVSAGQVIGKSGGDPSDPYAGFSTGQHLHFEYRWDIPAPQVPGGYVYNAVDPLPLLTGQDQPDPGTLFRIRVITAVLRIRTGPGLGYEAIGVTTQNTVHEVYEMKFGWYRIGEGRWVSGDPSLVQKLDPIPEPPAPDPDPDPEPTFEERLAALEARVTALENNS